MDTKQVITPSKTEIHCEKCMEGDVFKRIGITACEGCCRRE